MSSRKVFSDSSGAEEIFRQLDDCQGFDETLSRQLIRIASNPENAWDFRLFCALLLQWQFLKIPPGDLETLDALLVRIGLKSRKGLGVRLAKRLLDEGFKSRDLAPFSKEWRRYLGRQNHLFSGLREQNTTFDKYENLIQTSRCPAKVALSRYLIKPGEVVQQILRQVRVTRGVRAPYVEENLSVAREAERTRQQMPRYEREILEELCGQDYVLWVADHTSSELNSLVEYPLGTVVLVIKPPGSHFEFELKRAGKRGSRPIDVVFQRNGIAVPPSHRLDGGSILWCQQFEADASARLYRAFFHIHGVDLNGARTHAIQSIYGVPYEDGETNIMEYLMTPSVYGSGYDLMRDALEEAANKGMHSSRPGVSELPGELGISHNFLIKYWPGQAIQSGNSSFRVDLLNRYLSPSGPRHYFEIGLKRQADPGEKLAFAEGLLQEILGDYRRSSTPFKGYSQFIKAAFKVGSNRRRANRNYLALLDQAGTFWGTLIGIRGFSIGESFVARNVGIRSSWEDGQWTTKLVFMDHDDLHLPGQGTKNFLPLNILDGQCADQNFIVGKSERHVKTSLYTQLGEIYRVSADLRNEGLQRLHRAKQRAYFKTQRSFRTSKGLREMFTPMFADRIQHWDRAMKAHKLALSEGRDPKTAVKRLLKKWEYGENITEHYLKAVWEYDDAWSGLFFLGRRK